ncbi:hypothetical protein CPB85DRAFT_524258 [Mucidula mucida]|nr:hypothetical protein CPB85DRAFT_524258 [Mucidula mucida]
MSQPPAPPSPPPPAYSEQEFDAKVATALQASLHISQARKPQEEEEEWEEWDEAAFEAAAREASGQERSASPSASSSGGSSSSRALPPPPAAHRNSASPPVIRPLNIHKKNRSSSSSYSGSVTSQPASTSSRPSEKPRPSWYDEAGLGQSTASPSTAPSAFIIHNTTENDEDYSVPPPPFSAMGPSLDGPPFEEVEHRTPQPRPLMTMRPPSVAPVPQQTLQYDRHHHPRTPPPPPPLSPSPSHARMNFNPSVAYGKMRNPAPYPEAHQIQSIDAAAFYNSSVASHLAPATPQRPHSVLPV